MWPDIEVHIWVMGAAACCSYVSYRSGHLRPSRKNLVSFIAGHSINAGQICCMIAACCDCICGSYSSWQDCMFSSNFSVMSV